MRSWLAGLTFLSIACSGQDADDDDGSADDGSSSSSSSSGGSSSGGGSSSSSSGASAGSSSSGGGTASLYSQVQSLFDARCTSCHGGDMPDATLDLTTLVNTIDADSFELPGEKLVIPGDPDHSVLVQAIEGDPPGALGRMPKQGPALPKASTDLVRKWVEEGAEGAF